MDKKTREELKESLKWIRWKKYRKKVEIIDSRIEYRYGEMKMVVTLRDNNKKMFKKVTLREVMGNGLLVSGNEVLDRYVNKKLGYRYIKNKEGVE